VKFAFAFLELDDASNMLRLKTVNETQLEDHPFFQACSAPSSASGDQPPVERAD